MLKLTEKSCEIYCLTIHAYLLMKKQEIKHKYHISKVFILGQSFTI